MIPQWNDMRTTTLEEHFATAGFLDGPGRELKDQALKYNSSRAIRLIEQLCDVGDERLARMDAAHTDMQVLSLTFPGTEQLEAAEATVLARDTNDYLADAIQKHPARLSAISPAMRLISASHHLSLIASIAVIASSIQCQASSN
jgi:predicted TIM-barrel fold metal-dependent hydrolase